MFECSLAFIAAYTKLHRRPPAEADLQKYFGVTPPTVHNMILTLEKHRLIARVPGRARSIEVLVPVVDFLNSNNAGLLTSVPTSHRAASDQTSTSSIS